MIPAAPHRPDAVLEACLAFFPVPFRECSSFAAVEEEMRGRERLDFHLEEELIPEAWADLREEARPLYRKLAIWEAEIRPLQG